MKKSGFRIVIFRFQIFKYAAGYNIRLFTNALKSLLFFIERIIFLTILLIGWPIFIVSGILPRRSCSNLVLYIFQYKRDRPLVQVSPVVSIFLPDEPRMIG